MDLEERDDVFWIYLAQENDCWCSSCELPSSFDVGWVGGGRFLCCLGNYRFLKKEESGLGSNISR